LRVSSANKEGSPAQGPTLVKHIDTVRRLFGITHVSLRKVTGTCSVVNIDIQYNNAKETKNVTQINY